MHSYIERGLEGIVKDRLGDNPAVAILGPRQCGKSTTAKRILECYPSSVYLDLERPSDRKKLENAELFFEYNRGKLICLDEIQLVPELFSLLRSVIDDVQVNGQFLILGSASRDLINQSQTLAGRLSYLELTPFLYSEIKEDQGLMKYWTVGGFPRSFLVEEKTSYQWRKDFVSSFLLRDLPQVGFKESVVQIEKFWRMCAHNHGHVFNASQIGDALGVARLTSRYYLDLLSETFMLRILEPFFENSKKRLIKSPKVYLRDSGILHAILDIRSFNDLLGHPIKGMSWEGCVIENIVSVARDWTPYFYRTRSGVEVDLLLVRGQEKIAIECKTATAPTVGKGFYYAIEDLGVTEAWIVAPVKADYPLRDGVWVRSLPSACDFFL